MELLLEGRAVTYGVIEDTLWPLDADFDAVENTRGVVQIHIMHLRKKIPLKIRNIAGLGYILDNEMKDHGPTRPAVDNAIKSVRGALKESTISERLTHGKIDYNERTGVGTSHHYTPDVDIEIRVTPKEEA